MGLNKTYAVFGLGRYGIAVAKELVRSGAEVLAVDMNENVVNNAALTIPFCKCADITDAEVIKQLGISNIDVVIIAMAASFEASVLAITLCKEAGVESSKVFPHNLRHLFARTFYQIEKDIAKLADILGHASINTTRIYIVTTGEEHRRKMENMHLLL